ncbi:hypothetical protein COT47_02010, partial [Candidatus Woesearchaeota archaeon CG08_land_8_20_14_0_20_43_7]
IENKRKLVENSIKTSGVETRCEVKIYSKEPYGYRNRMDFALTDSSPALRVKGRWDQLVPVCECPISNNKLNVLLKEVKDLCDKDRLDVFDMKKHTGTFRYSVIRAPEFTDDSSISFVLNSDSQKIADATEKIKEFAKNTSAENIVVTFAASNTDISASDDFFVVKGKDKITEKILGKTYSFSIQGFMQNNSRMAEEMVGYVKTLLASHYTKDSFLLDLYGGVGLFGIGLCEMFKETLIVESHEGSIESAKENITQNNMMNIDAVVLDAKTLYRLEIEKKKNPIVLTDPPRSGMHPKTIKYLLDLAPEKIIYVSCNPDQLRKELIQFKKKYIVVSAAAFDLFPQTNHIESIVELKLL